MMKLFCQILIVGLLFISCKKEDTIVHVHATNYLDGSPIEGLKARIQSYKGQNYSGYRVEELVDIVNGVAIVEFQAKSNRIYIANFGGTNHNISEECVIWDYSEIANGQTTHLNFYFARNGTLEIGLDNVNYFDEGDWIRKIEINPIYYTSVRVNNESLQYTYFWGDKNEPVISTYNIPGGDYTVSYQIMKNGLTTNHTDTIFVEQDITTNYIIEY